MKAVAEIQDAPNPVPNNASGRLVEMDRERWRKAHDESRALNLGDEYREMLCRFELAMMQNDTLAKLRLLAKAQIGLEKLAKTLDEHLKEIKSAADNLAAKVIPEIMDKAELKDFSLTDNFKMEVEDKIHASMNASNAEAGCEFLEKNGHAAIVKRTITIPFSTQQGKLADKVVKAITKALGAEIGKVEVHDSKSVHHSTLSAWARKWLQEGKNLDTEQMKMFGIFRQRRAKVSEKKN